MKYLLDTNVISELRKKKPGENVVNWISNIDSDKLFISCLTIGEINTGIIKVSNKDKIAGNVLKKWLDETIRNFQENILDIDIETCKIWSELMNKDGTNHIDALIAAQGIKYNMTLVTRNVKHYTLFENRIFNPFEEAKDI